MGSQQQDPNNSARTSESATGFRDLTEEERQQLSGYLAEQDAIQQQCAADGHADADLGAVMLEESETQGEVFQLLSTEARRPDRTTPMTIQEARQRVDRDITYQVADDTILAVYERLRGDTEQK